MSIVSTDESKLKYDVKRAKERAMFCSTVRKASEKKIHEAEVLQRQRNERLKAIKEKKYLLEAEQKREEVRGVKTDSS